jgi:hypothetical protein
VLQCARRFSFINALNHPSIIATRLRALHVHYQITTIKPETNRYGSLYFAALHCVFVDWFGIWQAVDGSRKGGLAYKEQRQPDRDVTFFRFLFLPLSLWMMNLRVKLMMCIPLIRKVMYSITRGVFVNPAAITISAMVAVRSFSVSCRVVLLSPTGNLFEIGSKKGTSCGSMLDNEVFSQSLFHSSIAGPTVFQHSPQPQCHFRIILRIRSSVRHAPQNPVNFYHVHLNCPLV